MKLVTMMSILLFCAAGCKKDTDSGKSDGSQAPTEQQAETPQEQENQLLEASPSTLAIGGMPDESEIGEVAAMDLAEAQSSANDISRTTSAMTLNLEVESEGQAALALQDDKECKDGVFCLAALFGRLYDDATGAAACNFKLLLKKPDGSDRQLRSVEINGKQIYFIDGFGTIGFNDQGTYCPDHKTVFDWARARHLIPGDGTPPPPQGDNDELFPPTRLVLFKKPDGNVYWKFIFFPKDFIEALAKRIPPFQKLADQPLDFIIYRGSHRIGEEVGKSKGEMSLVWDELHRLMADLKSLDDKGPDPDEKDDGGPPKGKMEIVYDQVSDPTSYTIEFKGDFETGERNPFEKDQKVLVMRSGSENYLRFVTNRAFGRPDLKNPEDRGVPVQFCINPDYPGQDQPPFVSKHYKEVPLASYLPAGKTHLQIVWKDIPSGKTQPDDYMTRVVSTKGGAFIHGSVLMDSFRKSGELLNGTRIKAPLCAAATPVIIEARNQDVRTYLNQPDYSWIDEDGFQNIIFDGVPGQAGTTASYASKATVLEMIPAFGNFRFTDPGTSGDSPVIK